jgi:hypothetical protein
MKQGQLMSTEETRTMATSGKITTVRLDDETYDMAMELARANFRKPNGEGHFSILLRALIHLAYMHPERFDLRPPVKDEE